ncbi:MAG: oxidoreductase [Bacteroidetes bacterium RIFCSPLOWO2_02_FULL_36_8]|nr:MAG: oxidoreductase [Bacteroidetes bacterium RIFCSPLOWO2_02_FULL_36_8]OFY70270.1 MAG: oxidoreductase [Bacteroidetes bacterium RIFCSPLOWO2_12_FULL_37_12]
MIQQKIKFAVCGCGVIGKRHADLIIANPGAELVALVDTNTSLEKDLMLRYNVPFFKKLNDLFLNGIKPDVVNICTPNGYHAPLSLIALQNNCHVVCEKPMALTKSDAEKMVHASLEANRNLFCVMQNRYSPPSQWLKSLMSENRLGKIYMVTIQCFWNRDERYYKPGSWKGTKAMDGGVLFTQFSHFIDIMYWLFGDIADIKAYFKNFEHTQNTEFEDSGTVIFNFLDGGSGTFSYSTAVWDKNMESSMSIVGANGAVKVSGQYMDKVEYCHLKNYSMPALEPSAPPNDYGAYKGSAANHHFIIDNVIETLQGRSAITTNALEGLKVVEIIERIYALKG